MILWHFGNTSVRSPFRLRDGLIVIKNCGLEGKLRGSVAIELAFCKALGDNGIVNLQGDVTYSVGRKWRSALEKMGFIIPKLSESLGISQKEVGDFDYISTNGMRLIRAESVSAWQECFLRSLASYTIPSIIEDRYNGDQFSPLRHTLNIMSQLQEITGDSLLTIQEMGLFVQCTTSNDDVENLVQTILAYRKELKLSPKKKSVYQKYVNGAAQQHGIVAQTFRDYADTNFRYLKATGLVQSKGLGIAFVTEKKTIIEKLLDGFIPKCGIEYIKSITNGADLPTDKESEARIVLADLIKILANYGYIYDLSNKTLATVADVNLIRHEVEELINQYKELEYANRQCQCKEEINGYMDLLLDKKKKSIKLSTGEEIKIPTSDAPAYFEWIVWRCFLFIDSLDNKPWESRRFKIDQDFLPVSCAPGNGPDLIFEYNDMVLIVEVTLTTSSRQEAAEGEPVRRHVAQFAEKYSETDKRVYGLFLAINVDTNTANTFRLGEWYLGDDRRIGLHIVPLNLSAFTKFVFQSSEPKYILSKLKLLLMESRMHANLDAPDWKEKITKIFIN